MHDDAIKAIRGKIDYINFLISSFGWIDPNSEESLMWKESISSLENSIEDLQTSSEKLKKIEDLMHPGYWGTYDRRREQIMRVLGSTREEWTGDPYLDGPSK